MEESVNKNLLVKLSEIPQCPLKTYIRAAIQAASTIERDNLKGLFHYRIEKAFQLIEKIIDQYIFLDGATNSSNLSIEALKHAEEATCEVVRYLIKEGKDA